MATLIARYLLNEGSGTLVADSSGNGHDMTITSSTNISWSTPGAGTGTSLFSSSRTDAGIVEQVSKSIMPSFEGKSQFSYLYVAQGFEGSTQHPRAIFLGTAGGNGLMSLNVTNLGNQGRWYYETGDTTDAYRFYYETAGDWSAIGGFTAYHMGIIEFDIFNSIENSRQRGYLNGNNQSTHSLINPDGPNQFSLPADLSGADFCLMNRTGSSNAMKGHLCYVEVWEGYLTGQEKDDAWAHLATDCDSSWQVEGGAPILDTGNVLPAITGATATVNSDSDEGLIYCAVRPVAFGPYGAGDEEAIKNGTDATWYANGGQTPVIGTNTFLPTGLSEATDYHCGFVQETVSGAVYEHDFNAALGGFTYTRSGAAWGFRHDGYIQQVAENVPVYFKCDYSGSAFTPHVDYQGLTLSKGSTNTLIRNGGGQNDVRDYWTYLDLTLGTSFTIGSVWMVPLTTTATVASCDRGADGTTYEGPWVWTAFVAEGTAAGFSVEISASRGTAHYAWVGGVPVLQSVEDGCRSWSYHCGGGLWAVALIIPTTTNIWKAVHFYPARKDAWQTGVTTYFFGGTLVDQGYPGSEISPVLGATVTTAASFAHQTFADMGLSETSHDFTVFMRMQLFFDDTVDAAASYLWTAAVKNTTSQQDRITLRVSGGKTYNYLILERRVGGGSATYETFTSAGLDVGTVYNIFISYDSVGDVILRVDDSSTVKSGAGLVLDAPRGHLMLGRRHLTDTVPAPGPMAIRNLKVWDYALTDAEMDDIHNAYP